MALKKQGMEELKVRLNRVIGKSLPAAVNDELRLVAYEVRDTARNMAPIDYGELREAITLRRYGVQGAGGRFIKGQSVYDVFIDMNKPVRDPEKLDDGISRVGQYAWEVHEHMGWVGRWKPLMPSKKSVEAGKAAGVKAGGKFMERALLEVAMNDGGILARLIKANRNYLRRLDK